MPAPATPNPSSPPPAAWWHGRIIPLAGVTTLGLALAAIGGYIAVLLIQDNRPNPSAPQAATPPTPSSSPAPVNTATGSPSNSATGSPASEPTRAAILQTASTAVVEGRPERAVSMLETAASTWPRDQDIRLQLSQAYLSTKDYTKALAAQQAAIDIGPALAPMHFEAGTIANAAKLPNDAIKHFTAAATIDPSDVRYPLYLGLIQAQLAQDAPASASLAKALRLDPDLAEAYGTLAEIALKTNNTDLARQHIDKALALRPASDVYRFINAKVYKRAGDAKAAANILLALDAAVRFQPAYLQLLAECFGMLQRPADAAAQYAAASDAKPADRDLAAKAAEWYERAGNPSAGVAYRARAERGAIAAPTLTAPASPVAPEGKPR